MDQRAFNEYVDKTWHEAVAVLLAKGADYAGSIDRLANFKRGAALTGATPEQIAFIYLSKHYDAVATYVREGKLSSEPIEGRLVDCLNYILLLGALIHESKQP